MVPQVRHRAVSSPDVPASRASLAVVGSTAGTRAARSRPTPYFGAVVSIGSLYRDWLEEPYVFHIPQQIATVVHEIGSIGDL
ncbi:hypothetical protein [Nocardia sp. CY15]|uniref:hypothetical protein n=1 Tax=Nocardia sp. CY15 TaxID=2608687 RepID=UPI001F0B7A25|nr:hypothetical protein [Nocardia sp. CY15]